MKRATLAAVLVALAALCGCARLDRNTQPLSTAVAGVYILRCDREAWSIGNLIETLLMRDTAHDHQN